MLDLIISALLKAGVGELLDHFPGWAVRIIRWRSRYMDPKRREVAAAEAIADLAIIPSRAGKMLHAIWFLIQPGWVVPKMEKEKGEKD